MVKNCIFKWSFVKLLMRLTLFQIKKQMCFTLLKGAVEAHTTVITDRHQCSYTLPD